jgi:hypothetical protein
VKETDAVISFLFHTHFRSKYAHTRLDYVLCWRGEQKGSALGEQRSLELMRSFGMFLLL